VESGDAADAGPLQRVAPAVESKNSRREKRKFL
jgi:hypothetical protein